MLGSLIATLCLFLFLFFLNIFIGLKCIFCCTVSGFSTLRLLDLSGCGLNEWSQVVAFQHLPCLEELLLDNNPLPGVFPPETDASFPLLRRFSLSSTGYVRKEVGQYLKNEHYSLRFELFITIK